MPRIDAKAVARPFLDEVRARVAALPPIRLVGFVASDQRAVEAYVAHAAKGCADVGIGFERRQVEPERISRALYQASEDPEVHGVIVFYPVFGGARDRSLQNEVEPTKDVEGLHSFWTRLLYNDVRFVDGAKTKKTILPCTPLGIVKILGHAGAIDSAAPPRRAAHGKVAAIFNRSEVVGRPLAAMLSHDGARVYSFDIDGVVRYEGGETFPCSIGRAEALAEADVVVTGVPDREFPKIAAAELKDGATCVNFSHVNNLAQDVEERAAHVISRVGRVTVAMLLRNTVRLYENFHRRG